MHGKHLTLDAYKCDVDLFDNGKIYSIFESAVLKSGATILVKSSYVFYPQGFSANFILAESHATIHTWPEQGFFSFDIYTCSEQNRPEDSIASLIETLKPTETKINTIIR